MASINKVMLIGNAGANPETRYTQSGSTIASLSLATTDTWKDKQTGERKEQTQWHRITFFGRLAEIVVQYVKKGTPVYVEGSLRYGSYEKDGVTRYTTDIIANQMQLLGKREGTESGGAPYQGGQPYQGNQQQPTGAPAADTFVDDDVPF